MRLDIHTLAIVTVFVMVLLGGLLLFAGAQNRAIRSPILWGAAFLLAAIGVALAAGRGEVPDWMSIHLANALVLAGMAVVWAGARLFDARPIHLVHMAVAPALWIAACLVPAIGGDINRRTIVVSGLIAAMSLLAAREIWRGHDEPLLSRWPAVVTLLVFGFAMFARIPLTLLVPQPPGAYHFTASPLFPLLAFGTLLFTVVLAFLLLNMTKERAEFQHKIASMIDPLSGVPNRRAFLDGAARLQAQQRLDPEPLAVMLFDLDRFKTINDRFGHATGDAVLQAFAASATRTLGADVLFGRIGGEEFAAVLPVDDLGKATAIAERVRRNFAAEAARRGNDGLRPTVSVGVTLGHDPQTPITSLLGRADRALYGAKAKGRNRVECADVAAERVPDVTAAEPQHSLDRDEPRWRRAVGA